MPRPSVDPYWVEQIRTYLAERPESSAAEMRRRLLRESRLMKVNFEPPTDPPSERSIRRIKKDFQALRPAERQPYEVFTWPESMESGALPWEASRAALDLLRLRYEMRLPRPAPLVREVKWFWRVTQAIPDAPLEVRWELASDLHMRFFAPTYSGLKQAMTALQWHMAYQPWKSAEDEKAFSKLPNDLKEPPVFPLVTVPFEEICSQFPDFWAKLEAGRCADFRGDTTISDPIDDDDSSHNLNEAEVEALKAKAAQGHPSAQYKLGHIYEWGQGVPKDIDEATRWYWLSVDNTANKPDDPEWYKKFGEPGIVRIVINEEVQDRPSERETRGTES